jgi:D-3-phosphoglycerate dehydrogenase
MKITFVEPIGLSPEAEIAFATEMKEQGNSVVFFDTIPASQEELLLRIADSEVIVVNNFPISEEVISKSSALRFISVAFTGVDHIAQAICRQRGIIISNAAGYSTQAVAELTIGMAIDLLRKITPADAVTRSLGGRNGFLGAELKGKTFGILGVGAIGIKVAQLANAFGCRVIAWSRTSKQIEGIEFLDFDSVIRQSDILSLHLPLTEQTQNLIGIREFEMMKPSAFLINTARAKIVNEQAFVDALSNSLIAGAAVDIYEHEPPLEEAHPLLSAPNTLMLPHIGFATQEAIANRSVIVLNNVRAWINGAPVNVIK